MPAKLSEDDLIATYFAPIAGPAGLGLRDDAAVFAPRPGHDIVVTTDAVVAGVHFFADDAPADIARKALRVNLSDLAAKGAAPLGFVLALALPAETTADWLAGFAAGLARGCGAIRPAADRRRYGQDARPADDHGDRARRRAARADGSPHRRETGRFPLCLGNHRRCGARPAAAPWRGAATHPGSAGSRKPQRTFSSPAICGRSRGWRLLRACWTKPMAPWMFPTGSSAI